MRYDEWREVALYLFYLLDDIDTASDIAKGNDKLYREYVDSLCRKRFEVADTDGYSVSFKKRKSKNEETQ